MHIRLGAMMVWACAALTGCAEYPKPVPKRTLAHQTAPVAEYKKPGPVTTQSITPLEAPAPALEMSVEEQLKVAWKHICGLRNVEHVEKGRVNETEAQKHFIDEKCADVRRDSHMQLTPE
jgi:hypothetical protein